MSILVDTNVIIDIITDDSNWADWSIKAMEQHADHDLLINPAIYAELCFGYNSVEEVDYLIRQFGLKFQEVPKAGLFRAAKAFKQYKKRGGSKDFVLPDYFIGGHAEASNYPIMTRDIKRYKSYFPAIDLICP